MTLSGLGSLIGGIGLILLGMRVMTEGLRLAAGRALVSILTTWTGRPLRGLFSGALITSIVQSSSAVTVAIIGFVNAGLLTLRQAITVIYGSNVGTTMTGWLVALVGLQVSIKAFALPLLGVGMFLRLFRGDKRSGALGEALAGFGLFFIGVEFLKSTFTGVGDTLPLTAWAGDGWWHLILFIGIGFLLTLFMQSSSAAMTLILTSVAGQVIPLAAGAAMVIGANVGTTSTAAIAVIGATPNAKRVAAAHVIFNLITGLVAFVSLPALLQGLLQLQDWYPFAAGGAAVLALFHTTINLTGVILVAPFTNRPVGILEKRFRSIEEDESRPRYLDQNIVNTPDLAIDALAMELGRIGQIARRMATNAISTEIGETPALKKDTAILHQLIWACGEFAKQMRRSRLPHELDEVLPNALRVSRYYVAIADLTQDTVQLEENLPLIEVVEIRDSINQFKRKLVALLEATDPQADTYSSETAAKTLQETQDVYHQLKNQLLRAGTQGQVPVRILVTYLDIMSHYRRIAEQAEKAARYWLSLRRK